MTASQRERLAKALADSQLETIKAVRDTSAILETAVLDLRARLAVIEHERVKKIDEVIGE